MSKREYKMGECADCGGQMKIAHKHQRYCSICRLGRAAQWHDGRSRKCPDCGGKFIAWLGKSSPRCGSCLIRLAPQGGRESIEHDCGWHEQGLCPSPSPTWVWAAGVHLCLPCLTDPTKFKSNRAAILEVYGELTAARKSATVEVDNRPAGAEQE